MEVRRPLVLGTTGLRNCTVSDGLVGMGPAALAELKRPEALPYPDHCQHPSVPARSLRISSSHGDHQLGEGYCVSKCVMS